jgi:hypothetical protein
MGSSYGLLHAYRELVSRGDLGLYHGLLTPGLYQEEKAVFKGNYLEGFSPDSEVIREMEAELQAREWRPLCSI